MTMHASSQNDGPFVIHEVNWGQTPSPWLRLAHRHAYTPDKAADRAAKRHILDYEWIYQIEGDSWCIFPDYEGIMMIPEGSVALIPPQVIHGQGTVPGSHFAVHFDIHPQPKLSANDMVCHHGEMLSVVPRALNPLFAFTDDQHRRLVPQVQRPDDTEAWVSAFEELAIMWMSGQHRQPGRRLRSAAILADLLHRFAYGPAVSGSDSMEDRIWNSLTATGLADRRVRVSDLAASAKMGETAYRSAVKNLNGLPPRAWLERRRCEHALALLQSGHHQVHEVAAICGYEDPYHFSRVFKRYFGKPPSLMKT